MEHRADGQAELLEWKRRQIILRKKYADTPAGYKSAEIQEREEQKFREEEEQYKKYASHGILTDYTDTEEVFVGWKQEIAQIGESLRKGTRQVVLYGIGGIGKSALVRACIRQIREKYDRILFLVMEDNSIVNLICNDDRIPIAGMEYRKEKYGSRRRYYKLKCEALAMAAQRERILLVLDNCNQVVWRDMQTLFAVPCQMLITTRLHPEAFAELQNTYPMDFFPVEELRTEEEWKEFIKAYQSGNYTQEEYEEIWDYHRKVYGHTLLMMLKIRNPQNVQLGTEDIIKDLFARFSLKKEEKDALMYLSVLPIQGISAELFYKTAGVGKESLVRLMQRLLVQKRQDSSGRDMFSIHPFIAGAVRRVYRPTAVRCLGLLRGFERYLQNIWNYPRLQNQQMEPYIFALVHAFPEPVAWMATAFDALATFLWVQEYFREAAAYSKKIFESVRRYYGEPHQMTGQMALRVAAVYHNALEFEKAKPWYERGLQNMEQAEAYNIFYQTCLAGAYGKMARIYRHESQFEAALGLLEKSEHVLFTFLKKQGVELRFGRDIAQKKMREVVQEGCLMLAYIHLDMAKNNLKLNKPDRAKIYYRYARMELDACCKEEELAYRLNEFRGVEIDLCLAKENYDRAKMLAVCNLETSLRFRGETYKDTLVCREQLGDCLYAAGGYQEACAEYREAERILKSSYSREKSWICRLREKIAEC